MDQSNQFFRNRTYREANEEICYPLYYLPFSRGTLHIVDQIFIANAGYLGSYGNAANTVVFPLTVVALAIAVMIGDGYCAFVSICLGKGEKAAATKSVGNVVIMIIASSILLTAVYLIFQTQIIAMFGGTVNEETFYHSKEYFFISVSEFRFICSVSQCIL